MSYEITTQKTKDKTKYPITKEDAKIHMGYSVNDLTTQNEYLEMLIRAVTKEAEHFIQKDISYTDVTYSYYDFSDDSINVPEGNFNTLTSVVADGSTLVTPEHTFPYENRIILKLSTSVSGDPLVVKLVTGYERENVPEEIKLAILMRVFDYFLVQRGSQSTLSLQDTKAFERLLMNGMSTRIP